MTPFANLKNSIVIVADDRAYISKKQDKNPAWENEAAEKWNNTETVPLNHPIRAMREQLDEKTRKFWDESGLDPEEQAETYNAVRNAIDNVTENSAAA